MKTLADMTAPPPVLQAAELVIQFGTRIRTGDDADRKQMLAQVTDLVIREQAELVRGLTEKGVFIDRGCFFSPKKDTYRPVDKEQFIKLLAHYTASAVASAMLVQHAIDRHVDNLRRDGASPQSGGVVLQFPLGGHDA